MGICSSNDRNTLYTIKKKNQELILLPKNENQKYTTVLIWLTGLEEAPEDFQDMFNYSPPLLPHPERNKIIILCGEKKKITAFKDDDAYGDECFSWFDVYDFDDISMSSINFEDVKKSANRIITYIEEEAKYLGGYENIFLGGFSQGACMSIYIGCSYKHQLGGIICCSGALFPDTEINENNNQLKIFVSHGDLDNQISKNINVLSLNKIKHFSNMEIHYYPEYGHCIEQKTSQDLNEFFFKHMK